MKTLIQYLFEALVNKAELEKDLKFEETDIEEILDILDSDEYNHFIELTGKRYDKDVVKEGVFLLNNCTHFKIMYEDTLLGIFSVCLPENFNNLMNTKEKNKYAEVDYRNLITLFWPFVRGYAGLEPYDLLDKTDYKDIIEDFLEKSEKFLEIERDYDADIQKYNNENVEYTKKMNELYDEYLKSKDPKIYHQINDIDSKRRNAYDKKEKARTAKSDNYKNLEPQIRASVEKLVKRIMSKTGFVSIWQLSKDAKKKLDINQIALLRIFFQKLIELIKNSGAKYIIAQGKDDHITNAYIKLGGFKGVEEFYKKHSTPYFYQRYSDFLEGTVIKRI